MCGFFISNFRKFNQSEIEIMQRRLAFRGPDFTSKLVTSRDWSALHTRLSIIDLSTAADQPLTNEDGSMLVFNGEILNYTELGEKYFGKQYTSDTLLLNDLILNEFLDISELDGFFSFVFIDSSGRLKHAARDRFGVKPLFYVFVHGKYAFSSEPKLLAELFDFKVSKEAIEEYKIFRSPIFKGSFFENVYSVDPGSCFVSGQYFCVEEELCKTSDVPSKEDLEQAINEGIRTRKIADVPLGLLVSKGVDSNLLRFYGGDLQCFSIGFDGDEDLEFVRNAIPEAHSYVINEDEFRTNFEYLLKLRGEPLSVPNEVLLFTIAKEAKTQGIKVLLSGEGADEFFGGYDRIFSWAARTSRFKLEDFISQYCYTKPAKNSAVWSQLDKLFNECQLETTFKKVQWFFIKFHMPVLFRRLDFALMAAGVEGREPIANTHLFNVARNIASDDLMMSGFGKAPLRRLLSDKLGAELAYSPKIGFPVDLKKIYKEAKASSYEIWFNKNLEILE